MRTRKCKEIESRSIPPYEPLKIKVIVHVRFVLVGRGLVGREIGSIPMMNSGERNTPMARRLDSERNF